MGTISERQRRLRLLRRMLRKLLKAEIADYIMEEPPDDILILPPLDAASNEPTMLEDVMLVYLRTSSHRYLATRTRHVRAPPDMHHLLYEIDANAFRQEFRVTRSQFYDILDLIQDNAVFHNNSNCKQAAPSMQLLVTLKRLGCYGNGASVGMLARFFRTCVGTIELYTARCIMALLELETRVVTWPDSSERAQISRRIRTTTGFPACIGFVDGTLFVFQDKPERDGVDYYSRKGCYGMAGLVVCDDMKRIRYVYTGWAGCSHDARLMANSDLTTQRDALFEGQQYLLADSGFTAEQTVVPCFKKPPHSQLTDQQHAFNYELSKLRVRNEHCIGLLKGRFQSLKGLRLRLRHEEDGKRIVAWIRACAILHNLCLGFIDDEEDGDDINAWVPIEPELPDVADNANSASTSSQTRGNTIGKQKRNHVMHAVLAFLNEERSG